MRDTPESNIPQRQRSAQRRHRRRRMRAKHKGALHARRARTASTHRRHAPRRDPITSGLALGILVALMAWALSHILTS